MPHSAWRTPIGLLVGEELLVKIVGAGDTSDRLHQKRTTGPGRGVQSVTSGHGNVWREVMRTADSRCQGRRTHLTPSHARPERSSRWQWVTENRSEPGPEQELTGSDRRRHWGPGQELTQWTQTSFFRYQVFFDNDPSSSTSLLSSVGITTRS